jgi:hypothetical protein
MTEFEEVQDPGFVAITGELHRWTKELTRAQNASSPRQEIDRVQGHTANEDAGDGLSEGSQDNSGGSQKAVP